jgi:hypothetical protein
MRPLEVPDRLLAARVDQQPAGAWLHSFALTQFTRSRTAGLEANLRIREWSGLDRFVGYQSYYPWVLSNAD